MTGPRRGAGTPWGVGVVLRRLLAGVRRAVRLLGLRGGPEPATRRIGRIGEGLAASAMRGAGCVVIARNARVPMGEADLVCRTADGRTLIVVEVKTRQRLGGAGRGERVAPLASVTARKRRKLLTIARYLARVNGHVGPVRIDVVGVELDAAERALSVRHVVGAVGTGR